MLNFSVWIDSFQTTYNKILRIISGAIQSSPIISLAVEAGELPLKLRMCQTLVRRYCRIGEKSCNNHEHFRECANSALQNETGHEIPSIAKLCRTTCRPWHNQAIKIDRTIQLKFKKGQNPANATALVREHLQSKYKNHYKLYTDGSKCNDKVGIGVYGNNILIEKSLPSQCSVYSAEAAALHIAVRSAVDSPTVILSDSASCISALEKGKSRHPFIQATEQEATSKNVIFCRVPGHSGIQGNEAADQAANRGRTSQPAQCTIPATDIINWTRHLFQAAFQTAWESHRPTFLKRCKTSVEKWQDRENRIEQRILTRCRIPN